MVYFRLDVGRGDPFIRFAEIRTSFCLELFLSHLRILQFGIVCHSTLSMLRWLTRVPGRVDWRKVIGEKNPSIKAFVCIAPENGQPGHWDQGQYMHGVHADDMFVEDASGYELRS